MSPPVTEFQKPRAMVGNTAMMRVTHPSIGRRFANQDDQQMYEGDGYQWLGIGISGAYPLTNVQRWDTSAPAVGSGGSSPGPNGYGPPPALFVPPAPGALGGMDVPILRNGRGDRRSTSEETFAPATPSANQFAHQFLSAGAPTATIAMPHVPGTGDLMIQFTAARGASGIQGVAPGFTLGPDGNKQGGSDGCGMQYRTCGLGETNPTPARSGADTGFAEAVTLLEMNSASGVVAAHGFSAVTTGTQPAQVDAGNITMPVSGVIIAGICVHCSDWAGNGPTDLTPGPGWVVVVDDHPTVNGDLHPLHWVGYKVVGPGTYDTLQTITGAGFNFGGWSGIVLGFATA